jgi:hypothetical protein
LSWSPRITTSCRMGERLHRRLRGEALVEAPVERPEAEAVAAGDSAARPDPRPLRHACEQYFTCSQFFAHARRQLIGRPQASHGLVGRCALLPLKPRSPGEPAIR